MTQLYVPPFWIRNRGLIATKEPPVGMLFRIERLRLRETPEDSTCTLVNRSTDERLYVSVRHVIEHFEEIFSNVHDVEEPEPSTRTLEDLCDPRPPVEVVFIYNADADSPCHAVPFDVNGPWSNERLGFCGRGTGTIGPVPWCKEPTYLCQDCERFVQKVDYGKWVKL